MATSASKEDEESGLLGGQHNDATAQRLANMVSNDTENIPLMVLISYAIALTHKNNATSVACGLFIIVFTVARVGHSLAHYLAFQPWRSIAWAIAFLCMVAQAC